MDPQKLQVGWFGSGRPEKARRTLRVEFPPGRKMPSHRAEMLPLRGYAKVVEKERVDVRRLFQLLGSAAGAVAGFCIDADDDRIVAGLGGLQRRGVFERMSRHDAIVMVGGGDQDGWIPGSSLHVVNG